MLLSKGTILSAITTSRRVLSGAALTAVFLGAGAGLAFAQDVDNSDNSDNSQHDTSTNVQATGGDQASGDSTGGAGAVGGDGAVSGDATAGDGADAGGAVSGDGGDGGAGGSGGNGGDTGNTQNVGAAGRDAYVGNTTNNITNNYAAAKAAAAGWHSSHSAGSSCDATCGVSVSSKGSDVSASGDNTPVGAADTGDGVVLASNSSDLGGDVAVGGGISAAALLGAYGVSIARRRVGSRHAA